MNSSFKNYRSELFNLIETVGKVLQQLFVIAGNSVTNKRRITLEIFNSYPRSNRVSSDLESLENLEMSGNLDAGRKI